MINYSWAGFDLHFKLRHHIVNFYLPVNQQIFQQQVRHLTFIRHYDAAVWRLHCPLQISYIVTRVCGVQTGHSALWEDSPWDHPIVTKDRSHQTLLLVQCQLCSCESMHVYFIHLHNSIIKYSDIFQPWSFSKIKSSQVKTQDTGRVGMKVHKTLGWSSANPLMNPNNVLCLLFPCHHAHWILAGSHLPRKELNLYFYHQQPEHIPVMYKRQWNTTT